MYLEIGAINVSSLLSSHVIMSRLIRKYQDSANTLMGNPNPKLSGDEILSLIRISSV